MVLTRLGLSRIGRILVILSILAVLNGVGCSEEVKELSFPNGQDSNFANSQQMGRKNRIDNEFESDPSGPIETSRVKFPQNHDGALQALLETKVSEQLGRPLKVLIQQRRQLHNWMFLIGTVWELNGEPIDYQTTRLAKQGNEGMIDEVLLGLVQKSDDAWVLLAFSFGSTDAPFIDWSEQFQIPMQLFFDPK